MSKAPVGKRALLQAVAVLAVGLPAMAVAQMPVGHGEPGVVWSLNGPQVSFCIDFLMDSTAATKQIRKVDKGYEAIRAEGFGPLHPALRAMIVRRPEYHAWVPSSLCILASDSVSVGNRVSTDDDDENRQMVGFWAVAARPIGSSGVDSLFAVPHIFSNNHRISRNSELGGINKLDTVEERLDTVPQTGDGRYEIKVQKMELRWDGHLAGDGPNPGEPREWAFVLRGKRSRTWLGRGRMEPLFQQPVVGSLKIQGKGDLADALKASPMRMQGPAFGGGRGTFEFFEEY